MTAYNGVVLQQQSPFIPGEIITVGGYFNLSAPLANADTIVFSQMIPPGGVAAIEVVAYCNQLDSNAAPTGLYEVGDSLLDGNAAGRYITGAKMGSNSVGALVYSPSNVVPTIVSGAYTKGVGYFYADDQNSAGTNNGYLDVVVTVTNALATAAASGTLWVYFTYRCVGNI
jgi:hypothetical protein